jgi:nicotinate-nucleotide pyrophosphorylase
MPRFLIEVPHEEEIIACARAVKVFLESGSHFLRNADWGCKDGEHKAWIIVEVDTKDQARTILPPIYRTKANIVQLNKFRLEEIDELLRYHRS